MATGLEHCRLPAPQPLGYTTPSGGAALADCGLRTAYESDAAFRGTVPSSPAARLGTVCHRVLELAGAGALPSTSSRHWRESFEEAWSTAVEEQEEERRRSPLEAHWPPPERWPYYAVRKVTARRLCERISDSTRRSPQGGRAPGATELQEQRQQAFGGRLRGRADVIRRSPETVIEDYKTGPVFDEASTDVNPHYRTQMLLYAVLEHETMGVWPKRATLVPLQGEPVVIEVDPADATAAAKAALEALEDYNRKVADGVQAIELAKPSPTACRFCSYAIECPAFWSSADENWLDEGIVAVAGPIQAREESRLSTFNVRIASAAGSLAPGDYLLYQLDAERFGAILALPEHSEVAALWLVGDPDALHLRATLRTRIAVGRSAEAPAT